MSSLGLRGGAKLPGLMGSLGLNGQAKLRELEPQVRAYVGHHGIGAAFAGTQKRGTLRIALHPAASDIVFEVSQGYVVMAAETFQAGPGYHAFIAGLVDYLSQQHGWAWDFDNASKHFFDDTGYYRDRDFAALQTAMTGELGRMCQTVLVADSPEGTPRHVGLRLPFTLASDHFAATSMGFRDKAFFEQPDPARFFPWWEEGTTAQVLKNLALCKMWDEIFWQPHEGDLDRQDAKTGETLIDLARAAGAEFAPDEGVEDLAALARGVPTDINGGAGRIGYWRQDIWYDDTRGWAVPLPAFYEREFGRDGQICELTYGNRMVLLRSGRHATTQQPEWGGPPREGCVERLRFETEAYRAVVYAHPDDDSAMQLLTGIFSSRTGSAKIDVALRKGDDEAWAEKVLRSVRLGHPQGVAIEPLS